MLSSVLALFPARVHPLTLVSDPDGILAEPRLRDALADRDYRLIQETDPIALRAAVLPAKPFGADHPVLIVTDQPLNTLPYDLWQIGRHVSLSLADLFPGLDTAVVHDLTPDQRWRLGEVDSVTEIGVDTVRLSASATRDFLLRVLFDLDVAHAVTPSRLVAWLDDYHRRPDPLPATLAEHLAARLGRQRGLADWPLADLLADAAAYRHFVADAWHAFVRHIADPTAPYTTTPRLRFAEDGQLQALLPRLVASGVVPSGPTPAADVPEWVQAALTRPDETASPGPYRDTLAWLESRLEAGTADWAAWQAVARRWAEVTVLRYSPDLTLTSADWQRYTALASALDARLLAWLQANYSRLATAALPTPHHLYHIPGWLAHQREAQTVARVALLVLDGLSLPTWHIVRTVWAGRHPQWTFTEGFVLAQIPTVTAVSRQALIRGQRPAQFAPDIVGASREEQGWRAFWTGRGLPERGVVYERLPTALNAPYPPAIDSQHTQALCLVTPVVDNMVHGATEGVATVFAALRVWLHQGTPQQGSPWLESLVQRLLDADYCVALTSDHGHVEAVGVGQASGRSLSVSRAQRALLFDDPTLASLAPSREMTTILWHDDGVLPANLYAVMPEQRVAFAPPGVRVVSHGGMALDEMIVPLVTIRGR